MHPRPLRRRLPVIALAGTLLLPALVTVPTTARALPLTEANGPTAVQRAASWDTGTLLTWLGRSIASLWAESSPEGESPGAVSPDPLDGGPEADTGPLIDPNG